MAVPDASAPENDLPSTFVPGRNIVFLTLASIYAYQVQAKTVITGVCETDFSGYPDCRDAFVKSLNQAITLGMAYDVRIETPLMWLNKAEVWALADEYQQLAVIRDQTLTCYNGIQGAGCTHCAACNLRAKGWPSSRRHGRCSPALAGKAAKSRIAPCTSATINTLGVLIVSESLPGDYLLSTVMYLFNSALMPYAGNTLKMQSSLL